MDIKCSWCGRWINDSDSVCPHCGGVNENYKRNSDEIPKTIEELKQWAVNHNLPLDQMRTYIGENYTGPKAFGIYKDERSGKFIVYKNKADGSRAVRYEGSDEKYAVNELYLKMKERVSEQKAYQAGQLTKSSSNSKKRRKKRSNATMWYAIITYLVIMILASVIGVIGKPSRGYYNYNGNTYYYQKDDWYVYEDYMWRRCYDDLSDLYDNYTEYEVSDYNDYGVSDFKDTSYYDTSFTLSNDSWDDDDSWSSGSSWSDSFDDWDSDW